jgi:V/A-type H+-transporting ATPase subunit G/H
MSIDILRSIKVAEAEAEQIIKQSIAEARQIISDAQTQSSKLIEQAEEEATNSYKGIIAKAEDSQQEEIIKMKKQIDDECNAIRDNANKHMKKAVDVIIERIVKVHGNS